LISRQGQLFKFQAFQTLFLILDATLCPIETPTGWENQRPFYSGKHKEHGVKYEIGVRRDGIICWHHGPRAGAVHDLTVTRESGLFKQLALGEKLLADKAYIGEQACITPFRRTAELTPNQLDFNSLLNHYRVEVERTFARIKSFRALATAWRHPLDKHVIIFNLACHITNINITIPF